jgi:hypothetical protein
MSARRRRMYGVTNMNTKNAATANIDNDLGADLDRRLEALARRVLGIETLKKRNSDSLDFHDVAVWQVKAALEQAFALGYDDAVQETAETSNAAEI